MLSISAASVVRCCILCCSLNVRRGGKTFDIYKGFCTVVQSLQAFYARDRCNQLAVLGANACPALNVTQQLYLITSVAWDADAVHVPLQVLHLQLPSCSIQEMLTW